MNFNIAAFITAFPAFLNAGNASIQAWVNIVLGSAMASWFNNATQTEQQLLVAHIGYLLTNASTIGNSQGGGAIVSGTEGSVSASFVPPPIHSGLEYYLSSSTYGQMLWSMLNVTAAGGTYVGGLPERHAFRKVHGVFY